MPDRLHHGAAREHGRDAKLSCYLPSAGALELVSDKQIAEFNDTMARITNILTILMATFFALFVYKVQTAVPVDGEQGVSAVSKAVVNSFSNPMKLVAMFTATFSKKFWL